MFIAASTKNVLDLNFKDACSLLTDLEYDKVEIYCDEKNGNVKPSEIAADPSRFVSNFREITRLTPVAFDIKDEIDPKTLVGIAAAAKLLRITQISIPASPLGTPFNSEIDRLREMVVIANEESALLSLRTETGTLTQDPHTAVELCQAVQGLGLTLDPSHYICNPLGSQTYDQVYPHVYHVHLRDSTPEALQVPVGLGEIDYSIIISQLSKENYNRMLSVEFDCSKMEQNQRQIELRKLRMLLDTLIE